MLYECEAVQVHKFSKFQHAMAFLHADKVDTLPHWFDEFIQEPVAKVRLPCPKDGTLEEQQEWLDQVVDSGSETSPASLKAENARQKDVRLIEPKSLFANERTFLHYTRKSTYCVAMVGLTFRQAKHSEGSTRFFLLSFGVIVSLFLLAYIVWANVSYFERQKLITSKMAINKFKERLDVPFGPTLATALVVVMITSTVGLRLTA
jgi:hypothetical protein